MRVDFEVRQMRTGKVPVYSISYGLNAVTPRSLIRSFVSGPTFQRPPITIRTASSPTSPLRFASLMGQVLPGVNIRFHRQDLAGSGEEQLFYEIIPGNAVIARDVWINLFSIRERSGSINPVLEEIEMAFHDIHWQQYGASNSDDWSSPA
jgi:hypothetical protein